MSNKYFSFNKILIALSVLFTLSLQAQQCLPPVGVVTGGRGMHHARLFWSAPQTAPAAGYDWQLSLAANPAIIQSGTTQTASLLVLNLLIQTDYKLEVRSHCSETTSSTWVAINFSTTAAVSVHEGQLGTGADANPLFDGTYGPMLYPLTAQRNGSVANMLFTAQEMQATGIPTGANITGVAFEKLNGAFGGDNYPDLRMRLFAKNSTATAPLSMQTTYGEIMTGHTEVSDNPAFDLPATIGWINFPFEDAFQYSGDSFEFATAMYQNGQTAQFSNFVIWQYTAGTKDYLVGAWPINTVPMDSNLVLSHNSGSGQYKNRPNMKIFYELSNAIISINVNTQNNVAAQITQNQGTLQLVAAVAPTYVSPEKTWTIVSGAQFATLSANGLVTALENGTVIVQATSADDATITDTIEITITGQTEAVASLEITVADNAPATITTDNGTLQLIATVLPSNSNQNVVWSTISGNAFAYVLPTGVVTAINNGTAVVQAVSAENNTILDTIEITITGQTVAVASLEITVADNAPATITTDNGTLQLIATVLPSNSNQNVVWSTISGNAFAYVLPTGVVTAINNGTAVVQAVSAENNTILDTIEITITGQTVAVASLEITVADNAPATITTDNGTLQLIATVLPSNSNQNVVWSTISGNAFAYVLPTGVVTAINNGTAVVQAVSAENNTILDTIEITITGQTVAVASLEITVADNAPATITTDNGTLQLIATVLPSNSNQNVVWSTISGNAFAYVLPTGVVTAINNGTAVVQAVSAENNTILDTIEITITGQTVAVASLEITVADNAPATITTDNGTLQLIATVLPSNSNQNVVWSTISGNAFAYVLPTGVVTAINNGTAVVQAVSAEDNTILDTIEITITGQVVAATSLEITVADNAPATIITLGGTLQLIATVLPSNSNQNVVWSTISGNAFAYVLPTGVVTAINNGTAVVQAVSAEDNTILDTIEITVSGQVTGLDDFAKETIAVYPNPATTTVTIKSESAVSRVEIYNLLGQKVLEGKGESINISSLSQSSYLMKIDLENGASFVKRIIKE